MEMGLVILGIFILVFWVPAVMMFVLGQHRTAQVNGPRGKKVVPLDGRSYKMLRPMERRMGKQACRLIEEIGIALAHNPRIQTEKRTSLEDQACQTADYVVASLRKLARIRKHKAVVSYKRQAEVEKLENRLLTEVKRSMDILEEALVSLTIVDVVRGDRTIDRLLSNLTESNARLRDLADAHEEIRNAGMVRISEFGSGL